MAGGSLKDVGALADVFAELRNKSKVIITRKIRSIDFSYFLLATKFCADE
jgi:hypothetical protein